ncbi:MAG: DUF362 domain-containing protein [Natronomonas sp.]|uniref:DUF362 domain-containing protein n=1 Tax=Natronomonas sp. TaxID=2184060 RepID=UPI0028705236|nr:DUF362 domain-containing protein [Natronomonas sp.]MDR9429428.1 DUF362 domain-containing protein [Natronomonas sp.]
MKVTLDFPDADALRSGGDVTVDDLPPFALARREREQSSVEDLGATTRRAIDSIDAFDSLPSGAEIGITAGSRGIHDMPDLLAVTVDELQSRGYEPFIFPAMGSHGGATADGQREMLAALGITPDSMGCEIRSSMAVEAVGEDDLGRTVYAARDALEADAVLLANRVKVHTDFHGRIESGLSKMAVIGLGKHRGAESLHNAAIATDFATVIADRTDVLLETTPIVGGIALIENADHRAAHVEGVNAEDIPSREPELLDIAREYFPQLPVDDLDLLIVDELGKDHSGTGMDTNVLGRRYFHGEDEPESPSITRVFARSVSEASHGNAIGIGLADYLRRDILEEIDFEDMYINIITSGEPRRANVPFVVPDDATALVVACSMTGVAAPSELRVARISSTMEPDTLHVSEPVADELRKRDDVHVGPLEPLSFEDGDLPRNPYR